MGSIPHVGTLGWTFHCTSITVRMFVPFKRPSDNVGCCSRGERYLVYRILLEFYRFEQRGPKLFHHYHDVVTPLMFRGVSYSKLQFWDLLEPDLKEKGRWRITDLGIEFLLGRTTIPKHAVTYNASRIKYTGEQVTVKECWDEKFNWNQLMGGIFVEGG